MFKDLFYGLALIAIIALALLADCKEAVAAVLCAVILAVVLLWCFNTPCGPTPAPVLPDDTRLVPVPVSILES